MDKPKEKIIFKFFIPYFFWVCVFIAILYLIALPFKPIFEDADKSAQDRKDHSLQVENKSTLSDQMIHQIMGDAKEPEYQSFENKIKELLFLATDDIHESGFTTKKIDVDDRKQYFSEKGWKDYMGYVSEHKSILAKTSEGHLNARASLIYGTQVYSYIGSGAWTFNSKGSFKYARFDAYEPAEKFQITVTFRVDDVEKLTGLIIDSWDVKFN